MNRRSFIGWLGALAALPVVGPVLRSVPPIRREYARRFVTVGVGGDHETIAAAFDEVHRAGGGTIYFLPGIYESNGVTLLDNGVALIGSGSDRTVFRGKP